MTTRLIALACLAPFTLSAAARGEEPAKPTGFWAKEGDGVTIRMNFKKPGELDYTIEAGDASLTLGCTYTVEKDGLIKVKMTKKTTKGEFPFDPKDGFTFQFKLKAGKDKATVSDFDASEGADAGKGIVEGEYKKVEEK